VVRLFVLVALACLTVCSLRTSSDQRNRLLVIYLGQGLAEKDLGYRSFVDALQSRLVGSDERPHVEFAAIDPMAEDEAMSRVVLRSPSVIVAPNGRTALAARRVAAHVPTVFSSYLDPVQAGLVSSVQRRNEAATGIWISDHLDSKRLELLHDAYPHVRSILILGDSPWREGIQAERSLPPVAARLGIALTIASADTRAEIDAVMNDPLFARFDAWCIPRTSVAMVATRDLAERARQLGKPVIFANTADVTAGAPMSYALDTAFIWPALADLVARVLGGESAAAIPVQRPQRFVLAVRTGPETGLPPPSIEVVRRADIVIR